MTTPVPKPVVLCILDGWGLSDDTTSNAPVLAHTPSFDHLMSTCPHAVLTTHGPDAGLPTGQMGNSEVGHTNIGAGRVVAMDLGAIDLAIETGAFRSNPALLAFIARLRETGGSAHLMGVVSNGGVHGHIRHLIEAARTITAAGVPVWVHAITDGRDVPPSSAPGFVADLIHSLPIGARVATVCGRYWAMDRDNRWERVATATGAMLHAQGLAAPDAATAVAQAAARGETDEFIAATVIGGYAGAMDGDGLYCLNFRADRAREILSALGDPAFIAFDPGKRPIWAAMLGMVDYSTAHDAYMTTAYPKQDIPNTIGKWVAAHGLRQLRLAETEKYPHVTFFLNGGREVPFPGEERYMAPSPRVATYDLQPEMSAPEVADRLVKAMGEGFDLIVVNFANPDMVGHTGILSAAMLACEAVDRGLGLAVQALQQAGGAMIVCADHGNCEVMIDPVTGAPHTAHTTNPVPVILVGSPHGTRLGNGRLGDLAPTLLGLMGLPLPPEMTGRSLIL